jgi:hypothetical protein
MKATTRHGTVGKLAKAGMLAKVMNQRERPITAGTQLTSMTAAAGIIGAPLISTAAGPPESGSGKVCKGREASDFQQGHRQQQQDLTTETSVTAWWTAAEKIGTSLMSTAEGTHSTAGMPATVETPTTVFLSDLFQNQVPNHIIIKHY